MSDEQRTKLVAEISELHDVEVAFFGPAVMEASTVHRHRRILLAIVAVQATEIATLREALKGASVVTNTASAEIKRLKAERDAMREALEWMRGRDDRNGSLPQSYREKIDDALSLDAQVKP